MQGDQRRVVLERRPAGEQLVEDGAQRINVGGGADLLGPARRLFGGHVAGRAEDEAGGGLDAFAAPLGEAEVGDLGRAFPEGRVGGPCQQDVGGLQVAVDDALPVGGVHAPRQVRDQPGRLARRQRVGPAQALGQAAARDEFQREERPAVGLADFVDLDDVGVVEAGDDLRFGEETGVFRRSVAAIVQDHLEGDDAVELELAGLVDDAHAAAAQLAKDLIAGHLRRVAAGAGRWRRRTVGWSPGKESAAAPSCSLSRAAAMGPHTGQRRREDAPTRASGSGQQWPRGHERCASIGFHPPLATEPGAVLGPADRPVMLYFTRPGVKRFQTPGS